MAGLGKRISSLEHADERKNAFIVTVGHELRNPLSALVNALELLRLSMPQSEDSRFAFTTIDRQIAAIRRLVDDLLDIAGIRAGKIELKIQHISLVDVVNAAVAACRPLFDERTHDLNLILPDSAVMIDADPDRLQQVFVNLLQNAAKYTEYGGAVFVRALRGRQACRRQGGRYGHRHFARIAAQIFDLFARPSSARQRRPGHRLLGRQGPSEFARRKRAGPQRRHRQGEHVRRPPAAGRPEEESTPTRRVSPIEACATAPACCATSPLKGGHAGARFLAAPFFVRSGQGDSLPRRHR